MDATAMAPILRAQDCNAHAFFKRTTMAPTLRAQKPNAKSDHVPEYEDTDAQLRREG
jgi:hypothetical protein